MHALVVLDDGFGDDREVDRARDRRRKNRT